MIMRNKVYEKRMRGRRRRSFHSLIDNDNVEDNGQEFW
jgi:hypothetical protein